jgi:hypothetical protein
LADRYLNTVPADVRQSILDELEGRLRSEQKGMRPLYDEMRFLHALCRAAKQGEFIPNLGIKVHDERIARALERSRRQTRQTPGPEDAASRHSTLAAGQKRLDAIRRSLNMPPPADRDGKPR